MKLVVAACKAKQFLDGLKGSYILLVQALLLMLEVSYCINSITEVPLLKGMCLRGNSLLLNYLATCVS